MAQLNELEQRFITEMDEDFNAANGITVVYELAKMMNQYCEQATVSEPVLVAMDKHFSGSLAIFGLFF
ncbi:DALR domain-containing protein, partial [Enterococcus faecalis]|uniref:DALR domain-containing protein n=1 Tax=Enterococcus faecalis TaxID=1351 RepID=UPI003CC64A75